MLLIFQAMDAAGKDGAIKHVMSGVNPQGCQVYSALPLAPLGFDYRRLRGAAARFCDGSAPLLCNTLDVDLIEWHRVSYLFGGFGDKLGVACTGPSAVAFLPASSQAVHQTLVPFAVGTIRGN